MLTRSAKQQDGTFAITVYDNDGGVYLEQAGFKNTRDAEQAAERAQREVLFGKPEYTLDQVFAEISRMNEEYGLVNMTDDELLEALCV